MDWTSLNRASTDFLTTFLVHLFLAIQTGSPLFVLPKTDSFDGDAVEEVFEKTLSNPELAQGWMIVMRTEMEGRKGEKVMEISGLGGREKDVVKRGLLIAGAVVDRAMVG